MNEQAVAPGGTITSTTPYQSSYNAYASNEPEAEPEVITQWRERRDLALASREEKSAERQAGMFIPIPNIILFHPKIAPSQ